MRIRISRPWHTRVFPLERLDIGKVFDVQSSLAMYLRAMRCAEPVGRGSWTCKRHQRRRRIGTSSAIPQFARNLSVAEARLRIAGRWHRLRVELDESIMAKCSFYFERDGFGYALG